MKNLLLTLLLLPALAAAKLPVKEDIVAKTSDPDSPFYYTSLMMRYNAGDETLTDEDYHYLYYGYAHQESYKPMEANPDLDKLLMLASGLDPDNPLAETLDAMLLRAKMRSPATPFSPKILNLMAYAHGALGNKLQEKMYYNKVKGVLRAIEDSGDAYHAEDPAPYPDVRPAAFDADGIRGVTPTARAASSAVRWNSSPSRRPGWSATRNAKGSITTSAAYTGTSPKDIPINVTAHGNSTT